MADFTLLIPQKHKMYIPRASEQLISTVCAGESSELDAWYWSDLIIISASSSSHD